MAQPGNRYVKVVVTFQRRDDGGLRVFSHDVPGLLLSGPDPVAVFEDVIPALETLFLHNEGKFVSFGPVSHIRAELEGNGWLLRGDSEDREYVAPIAA